MSHILWLGGAPGSGKTTVAIRLARRHGLRLYRTDTRTWIHRDRALAAGLAEAERWEALPPVERWGLPTDELLALSLHRERGPMVVDDLRALPDSPMIIAEGSSVPAWAPTSRSQALWLVPSREFQAAQLAARTTPDGHRRLYERLRTVIEAEARDHDLPTVIVDGREGVAQVLAAVEAHFAAALEAGPRATNLEERQALLREANDSIVTQVRGYHARPWAEGRGEAVVESFVCECGDRACEAEVVTTVREAAAGPVIADGHAQPR